LRIYFHRKQNNNYVNTGILKPNVDTLHSEKLMCYCFVLYVQRQTGDATMTHELNRAEVN